MEDLVTVDKYLDGEQEGFSIIEVLPRLSWQGNDPEGDLQKIFDSSGDSGLAILNIHVRSEEAQSEVASFLVGHGFDNVRTYQQTGMTPLDPLREKGEKINAPKRKYYDQNSGLAGYLLAGSNAFVCVKFSIERLDEFKKVLRKLRLKKQYRNKWQNGRNIVIG